jgi:5-methylcytosine-specific restriction enzyme B
MSKRLKNLYTHLIQNHKHSLIKRYEEYKGFCEEIVKIRENLIDNDLKDVATYSGTEFEDSDNPFDNFITKLIYARYNGISSRGQSVLSEENLNKFKQAQGFEDVIKNLIVNHDFDSYAALKDWWVKQGVGNNPVLINRAMAACTTEISSIVDEGKFKKVFDWLQDEELITKYPASDPQDWYHKNRFVIDQLTANLDGVDEIDQYWISDFLWEMYENISKPFSLKKQVVKYGSPGTGKTYTAKQNTKLLFEIWKDEFANGADFDFNDYIETVQFHPSYTYEDFLEGLRPKLDENNEAQLSLQNGIFKKFCKNAGKWECDIAKLALKKKDLKTWKDLTIRDLLAFEEELKKEGEYWKHVFDTEDKSKKVADAVPPFFFIIDEINRAELSRVFGELMYCLEYRGVDGAIKTQYAHLNDADTGMIKIGMDYQFFIPHNVYLIGTMNTIDRSVESFDFALRRRFRWEKVMPDTKLLYYHLMKHNSKWEKLAEDLKALNVEIEKEPLLGRDFQIGHAYLWDLNYSKELTIKEVRDEVWKDSLAPLLEEYLRGTGKEEDLIKKFKAKFGIN